MDYAHQKGNNHANKRPRIECIESKKQIQRLDCACMELELAGSKDWEYGIGKINPKIGLWDQKFLIMNWIYGIRKNPEIRCMELESKNPWIECMRSKK